MVRGFSGNSRVDLGQRLKYVRGKLRRTQSQMADALAISVSHYSKLEIGAVGISNSLAQMFCREFGTDPDWLLEGEGAAPEFTNRRSMERLNASFYQDTQNHDGLEVHDPGDDVPDSAGAGICPLELLERIIPVLRDPEKSKIAESLAAGLGIDLNRAWAVVVNESLRLNSEGDNKSGRSIQ